MISILLVNAPTLICEVFQKQLEAETDFRVIGCVENEQKAIQQVEVHRPDVLIMDIEMFELNSLDSIGIIKSRFPMTRIIIFGSSDDIVTFAQAFKAGAQGYLLKTNKIEDSIDTIRFVYQGNNQIEQKLLQKIVAESKNAHSINVISTATYNDSIIQHKVSDYSDSLDNKNIDFKTKTSLISPINEASKKAKYIRYRLIGSALILLSLGLFVLFNGEIISSLPLKADSTDEKLDSSKIKPSNLKDRTILPVKTITVDLVDSYQQSRFYTGTIVPSRTSELGFEDSGYITHVPVEEGDKVAVNTPLIYLNSKELEATQDELKAKRSQAIARLQEMQKGPRSETIAAAKAKVRGLREQFEFASLKSQRRKELYAEGAISREQFDENFSTKQEIKAQLDEAQSKVNELLAGTRPEQIEAQKAVIEQIDANLNKIEIQLEKKVLKAPFDAFVSRKLVNEGTVVNANQSVIRLVEDNALEARIGIPVNIANLIQLGSYQQIKIGQKTYKAKVTSFLPEVDSDTKTLTVVLTLDESIGEVYPGQTVKLQLDRNISTTGYLLPTDAIVRGVRGLWSCYVLGEPVDLEYSSTKKAFRVEQKLLEVLQTQGDRVLVRGTLQPGEQVIVTGTHRITPEQLVHPIENGN